MKLSKSLASTVSGAAVTKICDGYQLDQPFNVSVPTTTTSFHLRLRSTGSRATASATPAST